MKRVLEAGPPPGRRDVATWTDTPGPGQARGNAPRVIEHFRIQDLPDELFRQVVRHLSAWDQCQWRLVSKEFCEAMDLAEPALRSREAMNRGAWQALEQVQAELAEGKTVQLSQFVLDRLSYVDFSSAPFDPDVRIVMHPFRFQHLRFRLDHARLAATCDAIRTATAKPCLVEIDHPPSTFFRDFEGYERYAALAMELKHELKVKEVKLNGRISTSWLQQMAKYFPVIDQLFVSQDEPGEIEALRGFQGSRLSFRGDWTAQAEQIASTLQGVQLPEVDVSASFSSLRHWASLNIRLLHFSSVAVGGSLGSWLPDSLPQLCSITVNPAPETWESLTWLLQHSSSLRTLELEGEGEAVPANVVEAMLSHPSQGQVRFDRDIASVDSRGPKKAFENICLQYPSPGADAFIKRVASVKRLTLKLVGDERRNEGVLDDQDRDRGPDGKGVQHLELESAYDDLVEMPTLPVSLGSIPKLSLRRLDLTSEQWKQLLSGNEALLSFEIHYCSVILHGESHPLAEALTENQCLEALEATWLVVHGQGDYVSAMPALLVAIFHHPRLANVSLNVDLEAVGEFCKLNLVGLKPGLSLKFWYDGDDIPLTQAQFHSIVGSVTRLRQEFGDGKVLGLEELTRYCEDQSTSEEESGNGSTQDEQ